MQRVVPDITAAAGFDGAGFKGHFVRDSFIRL